MFFLGILFFFVFFFGIFGFFCFFVWSFGLFFLVPETHARNHRQKEFYFTANLSPFPWSELPSLSTSPCALRFPSTFYLAARIVMASERKNEQ
tara:strand:+ start:2981 stop:3259 length:279 start_codon:yes stop_codon:yes gene_type:complete